MTCHINGIKSRFKCTKASTKLDRQKERERKRISGIMCDKEGRGRQIIYKQFTINFTNERLCVLRQQNAKQRINCLFSSSLSIFLGRYQNICIACMMLQSKQICSGINIFICFDLKYRTFRENRNCLSINFAHDRNCTHQNSTKSIYLYTFGTHQFNVNVNKWLKCSVAFDTYIFCETLRPMRSAIYCRNHVNDFHMAYRFVLIQPIDFSALVFYLNDSMGQF